MGCKKCFRKTLICSLYLMCCFLSLSFPLSIFSVSRSLSLSPMLGSVASSFLAIINSQQSVVCCASAAFKCSNHKMSLEQLYSYFMAPAPPPFVLAPFALCCFTVFVFAVCLFAFGAQKKFPNMRLKLNVKMYVTLCVWVCVFVIFIWGRAASSNKVRTIYTTSAPHPSEIKCCAKWRWQKGSSALLFFHLILLMWVYTYRCVCVCALCRGYAL